MITRTTQLRIGEDEYRARCNHLLETIRQEDLSGIVLFDSIYILYYTGFAFIPTERPMAFLMNRDGERALFVPRLELEHAQANALIDRVDHYQEYPGDQHPMHLLARLMVDMGIKDDIGGDDDGYPWIVGYRGPRLSELTGAPIP